MENNRIKIALVDDEVLFRKSIMYILSREENFELLFDCGNGFELFDRLEKATVLPDIILMDIRMPEMDGVEASKKMAELYPSINFIILSTISSIHFIESMVKYGASSYLIKNTLPQQVVLTINRVYEDGVYFQQEMMGLIINSKGMKNGQGIGELSAREIEVLQLICKQCNTKEIADKLCISERTVEGHRKNMLEKTSSKNVVGLILWGLKNDVLLID